MRAAVLYEAPGTLEIENLSIEKPAANEVLVRIKASGLCHTDLHFMQGHLKTALPAVLGHEASGVVEAVGSDVTYVAPGDHVIACLSVFCGACEHCLSGSPAICENPDSTNRAQDAPPRITMDDRPVGQFMRLGAFAEQILVHQNAVAKVSRDIPFDRAALIGCGVTTGLGAVFNTARVEPGATVAVFGCGAIGLNVIQGAYLAGARRIFAIDVNPDKLSLAGNFGATDLCNASEHDPVAQILEATNNKGVTYSFEAIGHPSAAEQAFMCLSKGGTATIIGLMGAEDKVQLSGLHFLAERKVQGCDMGSNRFRIDMPKYVQLYLDGRLNLDDMVSQTIALEDINSGFEAMIEGQTVRSVITFD
ncbi:Zn-dependent alcohol dehydrogenase [uncultured Roseovarius sp.]|uniref:Zn-dependent alcohol dehydrogenase n=1 Tax=uncultured Roseovarius sp. TaxID=293344 RepID=UPI00262A3BE2|nr:Zn-dependent alcohol dehydrogenase [uncultured Roseovarius sp.]